MRSSEPAPPTLSRVSRRLDADVKTLNYLLHTTEEERQVLAYLYDPLIALDQNLKPAPGMDLPLLRILGGWNMASPPSCARSPLIAAFVDEFSRGGGW